jgi:hypothetical protein
VGRGDRRLRRPAAGGAVLECVARPRRRTFGARLGLRGSFTGERHDYDAGVVVVMADQEGNEFCLAQYVDPPDARNR